MNRRCSVGKRSGKSNPVMIVVFLVVTCGIVAALLLPSLRTPRSFAHRMQSSCNMKLIGLALHNYHDTYGAFPPAYVADTSGRPMHSWRVLLLPFLEQQALYDEYDINEPWDGPHNQLLLAKMPDIYDDPTVDSRDVGETSYQALADEDTVIGGTALKKFADIRDGTCNTVMVVENTGSLVPWLCPVDTTIDAFVQGIPFAGGPKEGTHALMADGSVRFIEENTAPQTLHDISTCSGGEDLPNGF